MNVTLAQLAAEGANRRAMASGQWAFDNALPPDDGDAEDPAEAVDVQPLLDVAKVRAEMKECADKHVALFGSTRYPAEAGFLEAVLEQAAANMHTLQLVVQVLSYGDTVPDHLLQRLGIDTDTQSIQASAARAAKLLRGVA
jgi:hypothetical protein